MPKRRVRIGVLTDGVPPALLARMGGFHVRLRDGRFCRDRLSWGGITEPQRCDCVGTCRYDAERPPERGRR